MWPDYRYSFQLYQKTFLINLCGSFFFNVSQKEKKNHTAGVLWVMNSLLVKVTDSGWQEVCKPTDRQQRGKNWQSVTVQNAISPCRSSSYAAYSDKEICGYCLSCVTLDWGFYWTDLLILSIFPLHLPLNPFFIQP